MNDRQTERPADEAFPTTAWTRVRQAQHAPAHERERMLEDLFRLYWRPLYAFFFAKCRSADEASDLVLKLRERFVRGNLILQTDASRGRLRSWLRVCARNLLIDELRQKRARAGSPARPVQFGVLDEPDGRRFDPAGEDADEAYHEAWRRGVLERALADAREHCRRKGRERDFEIFLQRYLSEAERPPTWRQVGAHHGITEGEASNAAEWVKKVLAGAIRAQVRDYAQTEHEVSEEIGELLS